MMRKTVQALLRHQKTGGTILDGPKKPYDRHGSAVLQSSFVELRQGPHAKQMHFVGLQEQDLVILMQLKPLMEKHIDRMVDVFYRNIGQIPQLMNIIVEHSSVEKLKETLAQYVLDMFSGQIGIEYLVKRQVVGKVHNRIGLYPEWYIGAFTHIQNEMLHILMENLDNRKEIAANYLAFQKLCSLDMQIALQTYIESYTSQMMKLEELKEVQHRLNESALTMAASAEQTTSRVVEKENQLGQMLAEIEAIEQSSRAMIEHAENSKNNVASALDKMDHVVDLIVNTKGFTEELSESSAQIGQVVKSIRGLSTLTNILSFVSYNNGCQTL
ncbi:protoglobin domain-containing protein [Peribacillus sp. SCS-155]|uniref:protoglobin domain-containing protein n=1 Tax=Peribacillus sedimenti TaxID=3115297 RepID=UPI00390586C5